MATGQQTRKDLFYPDMIPHSRDHPHRADFRVIELGDARGRGMTAARFFVPNEVIAQLSGILVSVASLDTIQIGPQLHMSDPWFCRFLLHSCDPNGCIDLAKLRLVARRPIGPGDLLSIDYGLTEDRFGQQFECRCGAEKCRHWKMGRKETPNDEGRRILKKYA